MNTQNNTLRRVVAAVTVAAVTVAAVVGCMDKSTPEKRSVRTVAERAKSNVKSTSTKTGTGRNRVFEKSFQLVEVPNETTGIRYQHVSGNAKDKPFPAANGSGVGALDYDLDGRHDLYFATGTPFPIDPERPDPINRIYHNLGNWEFEDVTDETGLGHNGFSAGIAVGDYDADGFPDVYVTCFGKNRLYRNCGDGTFQRVKTKPAAGGNFSTSAAFLDYDGDGLLDLYVCNYGNWSYARNRFCGDRKRNVRVFCSPKSLEPERDVLLRNEGDGTFRDVTEVAGLDKESGRGQGVLATDVNADGKIDLYLGNDIHPNFLYLNNGRGRFKNASEGSGTAYDRNGRMQAGMGVAGADVNRDGRWDLFVTNFQGEYHTLYLQPASNDFHDVSATLGLAADSKPWVGWGTAFVDFDLDGWKDLIVTNGHVDDNLKELGRGSPYNHPALVWKNDTGRFRFLGKVLGSYFRRPHPGRGLATVDLDNDGDTDVVITHQDRRPALLRNDVHPKAKPRPRSLTLRLIGRRSNRDAVGSRIVVFSEAAPRIEQIQGGGSYLSAHDLRLVIAVEEGQTEVNAIFTWPSGRKTTVKGMTAGNHYDILEPVAAMENPRVIKTRFPQPAHE